MVKKGGLGKGLEALIPDSKPSPGSEGGISLIPVSKIVPNPKQPRYRLDDLELQELAESIREHGILQPLILSHNPEADQYIIIAGERRLRAAKLANLEVIPAVLRQATDLQRLEWAIIENVQRADLTPLETAEAFQQLNDVFGLSHEEIAKKIGKSRVSVTNNIRLLKLPEQIRQYLADGKISEGHARALLGLNSPQAQVAALQTIQKQDLTVRQTEELVRKMSGEKPAPKVVPQPAPEIRSLEKKLQDVLGTKVSLHHTKSGGNIVIRYYSDEELDNIIQQITRE